MENNRSIEELKCPRCGGMLTHGYIRWSLVPFALGRQTSYQNHLCGKTLAKETGLVECPDG